MISPVLVEKETTYLVQYTRNAKMVYDGTSHYLASLGNQAFNDLAIPSPALDLLCYRDPINPQGWYSAGQFAERLDSRPPYEQAFIQKLFAGLGIGGVLIGAVVSAGIKAVPCGPYWPLCFGGLVIGGGVIFIFRNEIGKIFSFSISPPSPAQDPYDAAYQAVAATQATVSVPEGLDSEVQAKLTHLEKLIRYLIWLRWMRDTQNVKEVDGINIDELIKTIESSIEQEIAQLKLWADACTASRAENPEAECILSAEQLNEFIRNLHSAFSTWWDQLDESSAQLKDFVSQEIVRLFRHFQDILWVD